MLTRNPFNPTLWKAYSSELNEKGCKICIHYSEQLTFGIMINECAKKYPWVGHTTINRCKSGKVK